MNPNTPCLAIRDRVAWIQTPQLPEVTAERQALLDALELIELARGALDFNAPLSVRYSKQRAFLERTDPTVYPVEIGGEGAPPAEPDPPPGDAP